MHKCLNTEIIEAKCSFKKIGSVLVLLLIVFGIIKIHPTFSLFHDEAQVKGITFSMANDFSLTGDVVINELMWMGSFGSENDEWIELRNMTDEDIDLKNWNIEGATGGKGHLEIAGDAEKKKCKKKKDCENDNEKYIIPKNGYFLITRLSEKETAVGAKPDLMKKSLSLEDSYKKNGELVLKDKLGRIIDSTPIANHSRWPFGWHGAFLHLSMERNNEPDDGTQEKNWHTCANFRGYGKDYWKHIGFNCGTPGKENLEKIDRVKDCEEDFEKERTRVVEEETDALVPTISPLESPLEDAP